MKARSKAEGLLDRILASRIGRRLDPFLGIGALRRFNLLLALVPMLVLLIVGLQRSRFGHMDTALSSPSPEGFNSSPLFPMLTLISAVNPLVGLLSALSYGVGDLLQKFVSDDIYYEGVRTTGDYLGARVGYVLAYSSLAVFGILPGVLARVGSRLALRGATSTAGRRANGAQLSRGARLVIGALGAAAGAAAGGAAAATLYKGLAAPAYLLRPHPDTTCFDLARGNVGRAIPIVVAAGAVGGPVGTATESDEQKKKRCDELRARRKELSDRRETLRGELRACLVMLQRMREQIQQAEADHQAMMSELAGATAYFAGATALAGALVGAAVRTVCQNLSKMYSSMAQRVSSLSNPAAINPGIRGPADWGLGGSIYSQTGSTLAQRGFDSLMRDVFLQKFKNSLVQESTASAAAWAANANAAGGLSGTVAGLIPSTQAQGLLDPMKNQVLQDHLASIQRQRGMEVEVDTLRGEKEKALESVEKELKDVEEKLKECEGVPSAGAG